jgi:hypothetical protein
MTATLKCGIPRIRRPYCRTGIREVCWSTIVKLLLGLSSLVLLGSFAGCVSPGALREILYEQQDLPDSAIEMRYRNYSKTKMCFPPGDWPNPAGAISDAETRAFLVIGSQRFAIKPFNGGYCTKSCSTLVKPGEDLVTRIPYSFFDLPPDLVQRSPKHLEFSAKAYSCRRN